MQYEIIERAEAPAQGPDRRRRRAPEIDEMVGALKPGKVARIELGENEKPRPFVEQVFKSAARQGKIVDVWEVGGLLYAEQVVPGGES
ncbi:MAG: hypothetical protein IT337_01320 [Thermomicrobiales bacterium]|nr:hypothetical protein [Thermomicrobiales bacterium]